MSDLTAEEQKNVRAAIRFLRIRCGGWVPLSKTLRFTRSTLEKGAITPAVVLHVARFVGITLDDLLEGRFPLPGTCPYGGECAGANASK